MISTCIQATVHTWDNRAYTQIRGVVGRHYDLDMQQRLYALVNEVCERPTGIDTIRKKLDEVVGQPGITRRARYIATAAGSLGFMVLYAIIVSRLTGIPGAVFRISCVLPLLPGANLYYTVLGAISHDSPLFADQGIKMLMISAGIALGYIAVDVIEKSVRSFSIKPAADSGPASDSKQSPGSKCEARTFYMDPLF